MDFPRQITTPCYVAVVPCAHSSQKRRNETTPNDSARRWERPPVKNSPSAFKYLLAVAAMYQLLIAPPNAAQQPASAPKESFDVISIRQVYPYSEIGFTALPKNLPCQYLPDRMRCQVTLRDLIEDAYQLDDIEVDIPTFTYDQNHWFAIEATMPPGTSKETARLMLQRGLADRFGLKVHWEKRDTPVYALVQGKNGIKIQPDADPEHPKLKSMTLPNGKTAGSSMRAGPGEFWATGFTLDLFAKNLRYRAGLDRPVVDMTGLTGVYTIDLHWMPPEPPSYGSVDPAILSVVESKLGLRLEKRTLPFNVLVVDHVEEHPSAN
jgi:uncharacterized protein (TIGR03435 family)